MWVMTEDDPRVSEWRWPPGRAQAGAAGGDGGVRRYYRQRLADDPHLWLTTLFDEVRELGFVGSYQALSAGVRRHGFRPRCEACAAAKTGDRSVIEHPPGEDTQWDWLALPEPPQRWGWTGKAHLLLRARSRARAGGPAGWAE